MNSFFGFLDVRVVIVNKRNENFLQAVFMFYTEGEMYVFFFKDMIIFFLIIKDLMCRDLFLIILRIKIYVYVYNKQF